MHEFSSQFLDNQPDMECTSTLRKGVIVLSCRLKWYTVPLDVLSCPVLSPPPSMQEAGRLVPCGVDEWVHVNCAVWSAEVYEEHNGILRCVHTAISRGLRMVRGH